MTKIAIFADVQNIYYTVRQIFDAHFDYKSLWNKAISEGEIVKAYAYAINRNDKKQMQFQQALTSIGFEVKLKPFIQRKDGTAKGDWDVGITIDVLEMAPKVDRVFLLSGDGDFDMLINKVQEKYSTMVTVFGVQELTADSLIKAADKFYPIDDKFLLSL